jgi:hypothetical protein
VPLTFVRDPALVLSAIAQALDVREAGHRSLLDGITHALREQKALLILDNFVEPLPEKVVIHWHKPISEIHARILPQYGQALVSFRQDGLSSTRMLPR